MNEILHGDVIEKLKELETGTVQCVVTSPPYWGLRDYGTASWEGGDENCEHIEQKCLASDKNKLSGGRGDKTRQTISMQYKKECRECGAIRKDRQIGLEETPEKYVEKMVDVFREIKRVLKKDGTVWLNLGDSYCGGKRKSNPKQSMNGEKETGHEIGYTPSRDMNHDTIKPKDLCMIPARVAIALQADGWYLRQDIIWHKPNPMPESVQDRCTKSHEFIFLLTKSAKYYFDNEAIKEKTLTNDNSTRDRDNTRLNNTPGRSKMNGLKTNDYETRNKRSVWTINTQPFKDCHFAVFPPKIPELCIKAGSKEGDTVLDPFFGSGTTGWVAQRLGRKWIGIELNAEYIKIAEKRFMQKELFA